MNLPCNQVKRLYDTFHEPFKRVVSSGPTVPEASAQNNAEPCSVNEDKGDEEEEKKDTEDETKHKKKEPELTVKSALSAAFAKYADKVGKKNRKSPGGKRKGETSNAIEDEVGKSSSIFKNTDCAQKSKASESYKEQRDTSVKVQESNLKSSGRVTRSSARSSLTSSIDSHD